MHEPSNAAKISETRVTPVRMVRFVCKRCDRPLVWADISASVKCPSCGRWINANRFWQDNGVKRKGKRALMVPEQLELF
jgi:predicted RNA-binding Zn-ribbon protein involved in translation (DUF1610 family)